MAVKVMTDGAQPRRSHRLGDRMMTHIVEKSATAGELPPRLRGDIEPSAAVLVSVRRLTENGFTEEFEDHVLAAERSGFSEPMEAKEAIAVLRRIADENNIR